MSNIQNQKSGLAKLLATENLTIQHQKIPTAAFDPKNRVLYCPIWEDMSGDLYDLLMGHEVGHALDTPADGWHDTVHAMGKNYKGFLNVVEDARIEKRQKRRYPGLRSSFIRGYDELMKRNFFGIKDRDINTMSFIDRLNIFTKSGYTQDITFTGDELVMIEKVKECETWEDVLRVTNEIWDYSKKEQQENELPEEYDYRFEKSDSDGDSDTGDGDGDTETDGEGEEEGKSKGELDEDGEETEGKGQGQGDDDEDGEDDDELTDIINRRKESVGTDEDFEPTCETDDNFRKNEASLVAAKAREYVYVNIPTPNLERIVTPAKRVHELLTKAFTDQCGTVAYSSGANELYNEFRRKNERYISMLAKEFEMRKAASKFAKAKVSETGDIDVNKIYKYQIDDNIFKKIMRVPKGKSHGMILLLDKSGSMAGNLASSYEQILVLAMFCRKVNIPFTAYGFGNARHLRDMDFPNERNSDFDVKVGAYNTGYSSGCFTENVGEIRCSEVYLREMINSKMSNAEFSKSVKNILCLMDAWAHRHGAPGKFLRPQCDSLSNTPLSEALIALQPIIKEFRRINNLDIVNTTIVHDGDADSIIWTHSPDGEKTNYFSTTNQNVFLVDKKNKVQVNLKVSDDDVREGVCEWLQKTTGTKIVGFYLTPISNAKAALKRRLFNDELEAVRHNYHEASEVFAKHVKKLKKEKYLESKNVGYDSFYILPAGLDLAIDDESFEVTGKATASNLTKAFMKFNKARQINRVLVSRFITQIAV